MPHLPTVSINDYPNQECVGNMRHEYTSGHVFDMSDSSELHNTVAAELFALIYAQLPDECSAFMSDMKVKVEVSDNIFF